MADEFTRNERRASLTIERLGQVNRGFGYVDYERPAHDEYVLVSYLRRIISTDRNLRDTTREMYLRNVRVHLDGTALGNTDARDIEPEHVSA